MSHNNPPVRNAVIAALKERGPMTCAEVASFLEWDLERVRSCIRSARWLHPGKLFRVVGYRAAGDNGGKDNSIYAAEVGDDVPRKLHPKTLAKRRRESQARYRKKHNAIVNARIRAARAIKAGRMAQASPWDALASGGARSAIAQATLRSQPAKSAGFFFGATDGH